jgi:hypothetical protein
MPDLFFGRGFLFVFGGERVFCVLGLGVRQVSAAAAAAGE